MKFGIRKALALAAAVAITVPVAAALAAPTSIPDPEIPVIDTGGLPVTLPSGPGCGINATAPASDKCSVADLLPPTSLPDPEAIGAMLQGQISLIAASLGETPDDLLQRVFSTEIGSVGKVTMSVNDLLNRLAGTKVFDANSNGLVGSTEISIGNVSHAFSMTGIAKPAITVPCAAGLTDAQCAAVANPRANELPTYTQRSTNWLPKVPVLIPGVQFCITPAACVKLTPDNSILGTALVDLLAPIAVGLAGGVAGPLLPALPVQIPVTGPISQGADGKVSIPTDPTPNNICTADPLPALCQDIGSLILNQAAIMSLGTGPVFNIKGTGFEQLDTTTGKMVKKGVHSGGTFGSGLLGPTSGNIDTAFRGLPTTIPGVGTIVDRSIVPVYVPLLTSTTTLVDNAVDFIGFKVADVATARSCKNDAAVTITTDEYGVKSANYPTSTCKTSGSFSGFGLTVYGDHAPVNFETDLAPLWQPAPPSVEAIANAETAVLAALAPSFPDPLGTVTYALGLAGLVDTDTLLGVADTGSLLGILDVLNGGDLPTDLPIDLPTGIPALPTGDLPGTGDLPLGSLPVDLSSILTMIPMLP